MRLQAEDFCIKNRNCILDKDTLTTLNLSGKSVAGKNIEIKNTNYKDFSLNYNFNQRGDSITNNYTPDDNSAEENQ